MKLIVDASVAIKWTLSEPLSEAAHRLAQAKYVLIAPDFCLIEASNIFWKKHRRGELFQEHIHEAFTTFSNPITQLIQTIPLIPRIQELSIEMDHPAYDCVYLAVAEHENCPLVTADRRLYEKVTASPYAPLICWIENLPPVTPHVVE